MRRRYTSSIQKFQLQSGKTNGTYASNKVLKLPQIPQAKSSQRGLRLLQKKSTSFQWGLKKIQPDNKQIQQSDPFSAKAYAVFDGSMNCLCEKQEHEKMEIASLTKIMTLLVSVRLARQYGLKMNQTYFRVSVNAANMTGTSAELEPKEWLTIEDLLYGLMLPSGNDAAMVLAENFGAFLYYDEQGERKVLQAIRSLDVIQDGYLLRLYSEYFVKFMNKTAQGFSLMETHFMNAHGLSSKQAYSTVHDIALLLNALCKEPAALKVMKTQFYSCQAQVKLRQEMNCREIQWENTHRLIGKGGWVAGKTGQTPGAGNCLASLYQNDDSFYFIIVLGCKSRDLRFVESEKILLKALETKTL